MVRSGTAAKRVDVDGVVAHLRALLAGGKAEEAVALVGELLARLQHDNERLTLDVARLLRRHVGRTSERVSGEQLALLLEMLGPAAPADAVVQGTVVTLPPPSPTDTVPVPEGKPKGHGRRPLPPHLPREVVSHVVEAEKRQCTLCGRERTCVGHETSEVLDFQPASFRVVTHQREKLACRQCEEAGVVTAPAPDKAIDKGLPGPGLLAHVLISKYVDHLPLYRLRKIFLREKVDLAVSTLAGWVAYGHELLAPVAERILELALDSFHMSIDDTGIKVLDRDSPAGAKRGHLWGVLGDSKWGAFVYTPTWEKEGPQKLLEGRVGYVQADAYKGYDGLFTRPGATAIEVGCWAHARRYYHELCEAGDARAAWPMMLIQELYALEEKATTAGLDAPQRMALREAEAKPILHKLGKWCAETYNREPPKSPLARAIGYTVNQWEALNRYLEDGRLPIDNTAVERQLRPIAVGRRNYLFAGSDAGARHAATLYTCFGTCALSCVEPWAWLRDVIEKLSGGWLKSRLDELLPPNWRPPSGTESQPP